MRAEIDRGCARRRATSTSSATAAEVGGVLAHRARAGRRPARRPPATRARSRSSLVPCSTSVLHHLNRALESTLAPIVIFATNFRVCTRPRHRHGAPARRPRRPARPRDDHPGRQKWCGRRRSSRSNSPSARDRWLNRRGARASARSAIASAALVQLLLQLKRTAADQRQGAHERAGAGDRRLLAHAPTTRARGVLELLVEPTRRARGGEGIRSMKGRGSTGSPLSAATVGSADVCSSLWPVNLGARFAGGARASPRGGTSARVSSCRLRVGTCTGEVR